MSQALSYEQKSEGQKSAGVELIDTLSLIEGSFILDLGCGVGNITKLLSDKVGPEGKVVAVDPDGERLKIAREKYLAPNIDYIKADHQTFPSGQYDVIIANAVIHWIHDKDALFKRVHDNLRKGGRFAFTTPDGYFPTPPTGKRLFDELVRPNFLHEMFHEKMILLNEEEYKRLAMDVGFTDMSSFVNEVKLQWNNIDSYVEAMHGWFQGEFDPSEFDMVKLNKLKKEIGDSLVVAFEPHRRLYAILTK